MLVWPLFIICSVILAAVLAGNPDYLPIGRELKAHTIFLAVVGIGMLVAGIGRAAFTGGLRGLVNAVAWVGVLAGVMLGYTYRDTVGEAWDRVRGDAMPSVALSRTEGVVELRRAWDRHYRADVRINEVPVRMMVDTGASMVLLPYETAYHLGIDPSHLRYSLRVSTANGPSSVAPVTLEKVRVGPIVVHDVEAAIAHPGRLNQALLGMSFLERLTEFSFRGEKLILRHRSAGGSGDGYFISVPSNRS
ncbi:MAG: TIGR02281 family clan AA aspartic protease [Paracoccaceae bacterium]